MPVIQLFPREGLKSPKAGLDSCLKSLSTHHRAEKSKDTSLKCVVYTLIFLDSKGKSCVISKAG